METFYITYEQFWDWFDRTEDPYKTETDRTLVSNKSKAKTQGSLQESHSANSFDQRLSTGSKRLKSDSKPKTILDTEAVSKADSRYIILYGRHKPGKKTKTWEGDGYLTLVGQMAHICDLRGRMLEEPTILDEVDYKAVEDLGELMIGNTEIQVCDVDK